MENRRRAGVVAAAGVVAGGLAGLLALLVAPRASAEVTSGNEEPLLPGPGPGIAAPAAPSPDAGVPPAVPSPEAGAPPPAVPQGGDSEPPPIPPPAPSPLEIPSRQIVEVDRWPIEYVRRPQTLPVGMVGVALLGSAFRPDHVTYVNQTTGIPYQYHPHADAGLSLSVGVTDLAQINLSVPRILCTDGGEQPSSCSPYARYDGTGADVEIGLVRTPNAQLEIQSGFFLGYTSPIVFRWSLATGLRLRVGSSLVLRARVRIEQYANPPPGIAKPLLAFVTAAADLQVTRRLLLFAAVLPWGSVADVGQGILLELYAGASFSFTHRAQFELYGGTYNFFAVPAWSHYIPGSFVLSDVILWYD